MINKIKNNFLMKILLLSIISFLIAGIIISYLGNLQTKLLMPIRNLIVLGELTPKSKEKIGLNKYNHIEAINPVTAAQLVREDSLSVLNNEHISKKKKQKIIRVCDWFIKNGKIKKYKNIKYMVWEYNFDWPNLNLKAPWVSGMAQGHVIEIMLAAYKITNEKQFLNIAKLTANTLAVQKEAGGVAVKLEDGLWFEEYASSDKGPFYTLNGNNFALNGLWHLSQVDSDYKELFKKGIIGLQELLPKFDAAIWSKYDLFKIPANPKYHQIHINQLYKLYERTGNNIFLNYARKFKLYKYLPFSSFYRLITYPNRFLVVKFIGNFLIVFITILFVKYKLVRQKN